MRCFITKLEFASNILSRIAGYQIFCDIVQLLLKTISKECCTSKMETLSEMYNGGLNPFEISSDLALLLPICKNFFQINFEDIAVGLPRST